MSLDRSRQTCPRSDTPLSFSLSVQLTDTTEIDALRPSCWTAEYCSLRRVGALHSTFVRHDRASAAPMSLLFLFPQP